MPSLLPEFDAPPLDEVAMGIQFDDLPTFQAAHLGLFWSWIRDRYPITEDQPPLNTVRERSSVGPVVQPESFTFQPALIPRVWFLDSTKTQLVQLQEGKLLRNWRRVTGAERYPRYNLLIKELRQEWETFLRFAEKEQLGPVKVNQCDLLYINHIEPTDGGDLSEVFSILRRRNAAGFLPPVETLNWAARFKLPHDRGRLYIEANPVFRGRDLKMVLSLNLLVRGAPAGGNLDEIFAWFDLAHEWIDRAFDELTEPGMHQKWGKKQ